jgi:hypothetical protein
LRQNAGKTHRRAPPFLTRTEAVEEPFFLPLTWSLSPSSALTLPSRPAGTEPALLPPETTLSLSLLGTMTFGLECPPGLSAAMLSRSSTVSVSFRLFCLSLCDLPTDVAREAEVGSDSCALRRALRISSLLSRSESPFSELMIASISSLRRMFSRRSLSRSASVVLLGGSPRSVCG